MTVADLIRGVDTKLLVGDVAQAVTGLHYDSRQIQPGNLFAAIQGEVVDGNRFVAPALAKGAVGVISERSLPADLPGPAPRVWIQVAQARRALATAAAHRFGDPAAHLELVGVTGTNGKTTSAFLIESVLRAAGRRPGMVGTIEYHVGDRRLPAPHTTPESYDLQELFREMVEAECGAAVLEASSHALAMDRLWGCEFAVAVFTNLTQDHLDYHQTMEAYAAAKRRLFQAGAEGTGGAPPRAAVIHADDPYAGNMIAGYSGRVLRFGTTARADLRASRLENTPKGLRFHLEAPDGWREEIQSPLLGRVNVLNILAAIGAGLGLGIDREAILRGVAALARVPGRFETVDANQPFTVVVDYAHTPDALTNVLALARDIVQRRNPPGRVLLVFGCGGDRDRGKRPQMGEAAGRGADFVVLTSDNPRSEDPLLILSDARIGLQRTATRFAIEADRRQAIRMAVVEARPGDLVVLAGKGHENYQIVGTQRLPFDDREEARAALAELGYGR